MASHYQSKHSSSEPAPNVDKGRVPRTILIMVLCFCIIGAGVYALVHYVIFAPKDEPAPEKAPAATLDEPQIIGTLPAPPAQPTLEPAPGSDAPSATDYTAAADRLLGSMSTYEKICQLMIVTPETLTGVDGVNMAGETTRQALADYPVGGVIYNSANLESPEQTTELISKSQEFAKTPMFIAVDEEGGDVARVADKLGTRSFDPMYYYRDGGEQVAFDNAEAIASDLHALGFNLDFAPVADVLTNWDNTVIGTRAYSDDYEQAAALVGSAVKGFAKGGVLCTLKHFPGHGGTDEDSHDGLAYVYASVDDLKAGELLPFKSGVTAGADMVMVGHLVVVSLDEELPATLSPTVVPELLRRYLGYDGVVITDGMQMSAITDYYDYDAIVKGIFDADIDMILQPDSLDGYITAMQDALESGAITQEQLDQKVRRILILKLRKGIIPMS